MQSSRRRLPSLHSIGRSRCVDLEELPSEPAWQNDDYPNDTSWFGDSTARPTTSGDHTVVNRSKIDAFYCKTGNESKNSVIATDSDHETVESNVNVSDDECADQRDESTGDDVTVSVADNASLISRALRRHYRIVDGSSGNGNSYHCPIIAAASSSNHGDVISGFRFRHVNRSTKLALGLRDVDRLLSNRARIQFARQAMHQVRSAEAFVAELCQLFRTECRTWHAIVRNDMDGRPPSTCLEHLHLLSDELRVHLGRWIAVRRHLLDYRHSPHLRQRSSGSSGSQRTDAGMTAMEDAIWLRLVGLMEAAIVWTRKIITVGFRNLAHCDLERLSQDALWNIARGLEQFNGLLMSTDWCRHRPNSISGYELSSLSSHTWRRLLSETVSMTTVLRLIANERSKYAAVSIREHLVGNKDFVCLLKRCRMPSPSWLRLIHHDTSPETLSIPVQPSEWTCDDVQSDLTPTDDACVNVPNILGYPSPLIDFSRRESTFAARFLEVICRSTGLIRFSPNETGLSAKRQLPPIPDDVTLDCVRADEPLTVDFCSNGGESLQPSTTRRRDDSHRKTVTWGDASLAVAAKQTMKYYMNRVWHRFSVHLLEFLVTMDYLTSRDRRGGKDRFDSIMLCSDTAALVLTAMIQQCSIDGLLDSNHAVT